MSILYDEINAAVNEVFFNGSYEGLPIYLDLEDSIANQLAEKLQESEDGIDEILSLSVAETIQWSAPNIYQFHKSRLINWQYHEFDQAPPFSAFLLTLSLAAERMRDDGVYSANNYYYRLAEVLDVSGDEFITKLRNSGKHTLIFWKTLNRWLSRSDYAFGKPTARKVNSWTYVSYAISQSLVRDADRKKFHKMFDHFGISSGDQITLSEMVLYLHEWMGSGYVGGWLKKLWNSPDLRERVAYSAIEELAHNYESRALTKNEANKRKKLSWLATVKTFPKTKINLFLTAGSIDTEAVGEIIIGDDSASSSKVAFENADALHLSPLAGTEQAFLGPTENIMLDAVLQASINLKNTKGDYHFSHDARPIIPLLKVEGTNYFREVSRISLLASHAIICYIQWAPLVKGYLEKYARPGFVVTEGTGQNGVPKQWCFISKVEILNVVPAYEVADNLQVLVPISDGVNIHLGGGLKLAAGIWHASSPPEITATSDQGLLDVTFAEDLTGTSKSRVLHVEYASEFNPAFLSGLDFPMEGNNFLISAGEKKREAHVGFRSANIPRNFIKGRDKRIGYRFGDDDVDKVGFSAEDYIGNEDGCVLRGMRILNADTSAFTLPSKIEINRLMVDQRYVADESDVDLNYDFSESSGSSESCIIRGYHIFQCEPYEGPGKTTSRVMRCKDCNLVQIAPERKNVRRSRYSKVERRTGSQINAPHVTESRSKEISADEVLDAISYTGAGTWSSLENILSSHVHLPWQTQEFAKNLVDLGFVDAQYTSNWNKPSYWNCSAPTLIINRRSNTAFLSGFRSSELVKEISEAMAALCAEATVDDSFMAPTIYRWSCPEGAIDEIKEKIESIFDPLGRNLEVVDTPAYAIASCLPSASAMEKSLKEIYVDYKADVEKFDLYRGAWRKAKLDEPGVYRTIFAGRRYFYRDEDGTCKEGRQELVKLMGARRHKVRLHGYDHANECFQSILGCSPPGLYRRALVSLSGELPGVLLNEKKVVYKTVPKDLATVILAKLYG